MSESKRNDRINGLVLVGGKSKRMGQAKAHLDFGRGPQWRVCEEILRPLCQSVYFSVSPQLNPPLPVMESQIVRDVFVEPIGPLGGIISAFKKDPYCGLFVLACDLPEFTAEAAHNLVKKRAHQKRATAYEYNRQVEPLCAIYEPAIFLELVQAWARGVYCPRAILSSLLIERIAACDERWLTNINHAHELPAYKQMPPSKKTSVLLRYYALLREQAKCHEERVTTESCSVGELFLELKLRHGFTVDQHALRFARNDRLVGSEELLADDDEIVFIPPVSGG